MFEVPVPSAGRVDFSIESADAAWDQIDDRVEVSGSLVATACGTLKASNWASQKTGLLMEKRSMPLSGG